MNTQYYRFVGDAGFCGFSKERSRGFVVSAFREVSEVCNLNFKEGYGGLVIQWVPHIGGKDKDWLGHVSEGVIRPSSTRMIKSHWIRRPRVFPALIQSLLLTKYRFGLYPADRAFDKLDSPNWMTPTQVQFLQNMWGKPAVFWPKELSVKGRYMRYLRETSNRMSDNRKWSDSSEERREWGRCVDFFEEKRCEAAIQWHEIWDRWYSSGLIRLSGLQPDLLD